LVSETWKHYEVAFEEYLRCRRVPFARVETARAVALGSAKTPRGLKYFDYVVYGEAHHLLVELKGRRVGGATGKATAKAGRARKTQGSARLENWVTQDDVSALEWWEGAFGMPFVGAFIFVYWCDEEPPAPLFQDIFAFGTHWYAMRVISLEHYKQAMKVRSPRWRTLNMPPADFTRLSAPFNPTTPYPLPPHKDVARSLLERGLADGPPLPDPDRFLRSVPRARKD
jgi:hypothetical protein